MEIEGSAQTCDQSDPLQVTRPSFIDLLCMYPCLLIVLFVLFQRMPLSDSKDASVSLGARVHREAEEPESQMSSTADVKRRMMSSAIQCQYCRYRCGSRFTLQIHVGSQHPLHCEDVCVGRLGKVVFYQHTARLFHCHICFFTSKDYAVLFEHLLARHCLTVQKAVHTDEGGEMTNTHDPEVRHRGGREQDRSPDPERNPDNQDTTEQQEQEPSNKDCLKRKRSSALSGEDEDVDEDEDVNVSDSTQAANEEQAAAVELYSEYSSAPYYDCKFCKRRYRSKGSLLCHVSHKHDVPKPHACKECSQTFMLESLLTRHVSLHHGPELYQCPYCLLESSLRGLHQHLSQCRAQGNEGTGDARSEEEE